MGGNQLEHISLYIIVLRLDIRISIYLNRVCRNAPKLKITLATGSCSEGDFDKREVLTHSLVLLKKVREAFKKTKEFSEKAKEFLEKTKEFLKKTKEFWGTLKKPV